MRSTAQVNFSQLGGPALVALLDTQAGAGNVARPFSAQVDGLYNFQFLVWPAGYLHVDLVGGSDLHISEFSEDEMTQSYPDFAKLMSYLFGGGTPFTPSLDTLYSTPVGKRFIHNPKQRYLAAWVDTALVVTGKLRAFEAGGGGPSMVIPPPPKSFER